jgi:hypothetical protein
MSNWQRFWNGRWGSTRGVRRDGGRRTRTLRCEVLESRRCLTACYLDGLDAQETCAGHTLCVGSWEPGYTASEAAAVPVAQLAEPLGSAAPQSAAPGSWQNPATAADVDGDGRVTPQDVLPVINYLNGPGRGPLPAAPAAPPPYLDVNGDDYVAPLDVLLVIHHLNFHSLSVASVLTPFDANAQDLVGPSSWQTNYGKTPEIIVSSNGEELDVLAQDYNATSTWNAVLLHIAPRGSGYSITQTLTDLPMLDRVMGLATDNAGNRYYATGVAEAGRVNATYPPLDTYRSDIVRVIRVDPAGDVQFNIDLDPARHAKQATAEMIINPMVAATARLAVGGGEVALVHGINTDPDWNIGGTRHQKALSTRLDAASGAVTRVSSIWVSHSFDQRLRYDGEQIVEYHLGDAYPRSVVLGRDHRSYSLFHIKGALGENNTRTRLGDVAVIENDPDYSHLALFSTESSTATGSTIAGPRNLGIVRIHRSDSSVDPTLPDSLTVSSNGTQQTNRLRWLTDYSAASGLHAERPKLVGIGQGKYIVLWEEWLVAGGRDTFRGVRGMVIDDLGNTLQPPTLITDQHHLHRGDDAFLLRGRAGWMTGNAAQQKLYLHLVDASLNYTMVTFD